MLPIAFPIVLFFTLLWALIYLFVGKVSQFCRVLGLGAGLAIYLCTPVFPWLISMLGSFPRAFFSTTMYDPGQIPSPSPSPPLSAGPVAAPADVPTASRPLPWHLIGWVAVSVALLVVLVAAAVSAARRVRRSRQVAATSKALFGALTVRHDRVMLEYGKYETDLVEVFSHPTLTDVSVPQTAAFLTAWGDADDRRPAAGSRPSPAALDQYEKAVRLLESKWVLADRHSKRVGLRSIPVGEQRTVRRAVALLKQALDPGQPDEARQAFYDHALRLVRDIVTVPKRALAAVESAHRLAITTASVDLTDTDLTDADLTDLTVPDGVVPGARTAGRRWLSNSR